MHWAQRAIGNLARYGTDGGTVIVVGTTEYDGSGGAVHLETCGGLFATPTGRIVIAALAVLWVSLANAVLSKLQVVEGSPAMARKE